MLVAGEQEPFELTYSVTEIGQGDDLAIGLSVTGDLSDTCSTTSATPSCRGPVQQPQPVQRHRTGRAAERGACTRLGAGDVR